MGVSADEVRDALLEGVSAIKYRIEKARYADLRPADLEIVEQWKQRAEILTSLATSGETVVDTHSRLRRIQCKLELVDIAQRLIYVEWLLPNVIVEEDDCFVVRIVLDDNGRILAKMTS